ncbi:MAG: RDD family protein, partial [Halobacteriota archaeon]
PSQAPSVPPQTTPSYGPGYEAPPYYAPGAVSPYQGVAIRFVAILIDSVILAVIFWASSFVGVATVTINASTGQTSVDPLFGAIILIDFIIAFLYFTLLEGRYGQSVGKMALKMKVVREADGSPIGYAEAAVRTVMRIIDLIPFVAPYLLGAILIWSSDKKQRLGDRVAHTVVTQA